MGRMDVSKMRYLESDHFRCLIAVEMGMKNHEMVPLPLVAAIAGIHRGAVSRTLSDLCKQSLVAFERTRKYDGYRLTVMGYDYLALKALCARDVVGSVGNKIGVGKESDVFVGGDPELNDLCLKFHRLGRTSFRKIKEKRDYHKNRKSASWLYLARLAATKEYAFLKALSDRGFPVPRPVDVCRHVVVMGLIEGKTLCHVDELEDTAGLYDKLMCLIVKLARHGLIHGDFNEFNLMLYDDERLVMIDFPQMVSMDHANAKYYFDRDVECIRALFKRKYNYEADDWPRFEDMERKYTMDVELEASGFTKQMQLDLNKAYDDGNFRAHTEADGANTFDSDSDEEDEEESDDDSGASTIKEDEEEEEDADVDREEIQQEQIDVQNKARELGKSERFSSWLDRATNQLDELALEVDGEAPLLVHPHDVQRMEEIRKDREEYIRQRELADEEDEKRAEEELPESAEMMPRVPKTRKSNGSKSIVSTCSTISPEEVKRRVSLEAFRNKEKVKLRVKGKQSAVRRGRKDNRDIIKEFSGWI